MYSLQSPKDVVTPLPELLLRDVRILPPVLQDVGPEEEGEKEEILERV